MVLAGPASSADWPTYQHDPRRSGVTAETVQATVLREAWVYRSATPPQPAWAGPAKWDAYAGIRGLKSMRNYDPAFHAIVVGQSVYFGSSADDSVYCLDARSGQVRWVFTTDGPVRIAPTYAAGRLYFGSDDGAVYCLEAASGALVWRVRPGPEARLILHNGRFISPWPCRTGVLVDAGTAYFAASLFPWKESYLCAVDATTGQAEGPGRYVRRIEGVTFEGALLASPQRLISPQGRVPPLLFDRAEGTALGALQGGGGCFVLLTEDARVLHGPGNKTGWIQESRETDRSKLATFDGATALVVRGEVSYVLTRTHLAAVDRTTRQSLWHTATDCALALVLAGDRLVAGGDDRVAIHSAQTGERVWQAAVQGRAYGLAVADAALFVSTDEGLTYCYRAEAAQPGQTAPADLASAGRVQSVAGARSAQPASRLALGPWLAFDGGGEATVGWHTAEPSATRLQWWGPSGPVRDFHEPTLKTQHRARLTGLARDRVHTYRVGSGAGEQASWTPEFECDTAFDYSRPRPRPDATGFVPQDVPPEVLRAAQDVLAVAGVQQGVCLLIGDRDGTLAAALAQRSDLRILSATTDPGVLEASRVKLRQLGLYGARVSVHRVDSYEALPFASMFANLVLAPVRNTASGRGPNLGSLVRFLRPDGGVLLGTRPAAPLAPARGERAASALARLAGDTRLDARMERGWLKAGRLRLPGAAEWSHQYGTADNTGYAGEELGDARTVADLEVLWLGLPGPRAQPDRNGRKPAPLATAGRLFVQGLQRIVALDAFNGTPLWAREIPDLERFNLPRDCSNWCADDEHVYLAIRDRCWRLAAASGELTQLYAVVPGGRSDGGYDWGYVSIQGARLIGSAVKEGTAFKEFWGKADAGWYDAKTGPVTHKVCSDKLFARDRDSGATLWEYSGGLLVNSTLTIADDRLYFLASSSPQALAGQTRRVGLSELWSELELVALELDSGRALWRRPVAPAPGEVAVYLACAQDRLVLACSGQGNYSIYTFAAQTGQEGWQTAVPWPKDHHGGHMSRPTLVGDRLFVRPAMLDARTGRRLEPNMPDGGCGTYAATKSALFFRNANVTAWDWENGALTSWARLRPDCWLSTVPASGLLLSPEAGGGCSCGSWLETSIAFAPRRLQ